MVKKWRVICNLQSYVRWIKKKKKKKKKKKIPVYESGRTCFIKLGRKYSICWAGCMGPIPSIFFSNFHSAGNMTDYSWSITQEYNMASRTRLFEGCLLWPGDADSFCLSRKLNLTELFAALKGVFFIILQLKAMHSWCQISKNSHFLITTQVNDYLWQKASIMYMHTVQTSILLMGPWLVILYSLRLVFFSLFLCMQVTKTRFRKNLKIQNLICNKQVKRGNWFAKKKFLLLISWSTVQNIMFEPRTARLYRAGVLPVILYSKNNFCSWCLFGRFLCSLDYEVLLIGL